MYAFIWEAGWRKNKSLKGLNYLPRSLKGGKEHVNHNVMLAMPL